MENRENFSKFGALMAMAGSAVGLGNLWRFPYLLGENGGAAFLVVYLFCVFFIALPIFYAEFVMGRRSASNCLGAFKKLAPDSKWMYVGLFGIVTPLIIVPYYSVVGGWSVEYLFRACCFDFKKVVSEELLSQSFDLFTASIWPPLLGFTIFLGAATYIVSRGVKKGIERFGEIVMPVLFILVMLIALYVAFLPGAPNGYRYLFSLDVGKITPSVISSALGQSFFSMSLGCGCIMTYASYVRKKDNMVEHCFNTSLLDLGFAVLAGCAIMPAVFAFGLNPGEGPALVYKTLPYIFSKMPAGSIIAILFFVSLLFAALTSVVSMMEAIVAYFMEERKMSRRKSVLVVSVFSWVVGIFCSLSFGPLSEFKIFGETIFSAMDTCASDYLMTIGALFIVLFVGWKMKKSDVMDEFTDGGTNAKASRLFKFTYFLIRFVAPVAIFVIFITNLIL